MTVTEKTIRNLHASLEEISSLRSGQRLTL